MVETTTQDLKASMEVDTQDTTLESYDSNVCAVCGEKRCCITTHQEELEKAIDTGKCDFEKSHNNKERLFRSYQEFVHMVQTDSTENVFSVDLRTPST